MSRTREEDPKKGNSDPLADNNLWQMTAKRPDLLLKSFVDEPFDHHAGALKDIALGKDEARPLVAISKCNENFDSVKPGIQALASICLALGDISSGSGNRHFAISHLAAAADFWQKRLSNGNGPEVQSVENPVNVVKCLESVELTSGIACTAATAIDNATSGASRAVTDLFVRLARSWPDMPPEHPVTVAFPVTNNGDVAVLELERAELGGEPRLFPDLAKMAFFVTDGGFRSALRTGWEVAKAVLESSGEEMSSVRWRVMTTRSGLRIPQDVEGGSVGAAAAAGLIILLGNKGTPAHNMAVTGKIETNGTLGSLMGGASDMKNISEKISQCNDSTTLKSDSTNRTLILPAADLLRLQSLSNVTLPVGLEIVGAGDVNRVVEILTGLTSDVKQYLEWVRTVSNKMPTYFPQDLRDNGWENFTRKIPRLVSLPGDSDFDREYRYWEEVRCWPRKVVQAGPGFGKSVLMQSEAWRRATDALGDLDSGKSLDDITLVMPLSVEQFTKTCGNCVKAIQEVLPEEIRTEKKKKFFEWLKLKMETGKVCVLLDNFEGNVGLGDVNSLLKNDKLEQVVVTTRSATQMGFPGEIPQVTLEPFTPEEVTDFAGSWFAAESGKLQAFQEYLCDHSMQKLAQVPLFLSLACLVFCKNYGKPMAVPVGRAHLIAEALQSLLGRKYGDDNNQIVSFNGYAGERKSLAGLAFELASKESGWQSTVFTNDCLSENYEFTVPSEVLVPTGSISYTAHPEYTFVHDSVHEYLVAEHLSALDNGAALEAIRSHYHFDPHWEEVLVDLAELAANTDKGVIKLSVDQLINDLSKAPDPFYNTTFLAARCLRAAACKVPASTLDSVVQRLLQASRQSETTLRAARHLVQLGRPVAEQVKSALKGEDDYSFWNVLAALKDAPADLIAELQNELVEVAKNAPSVDSIYALGALAAGGLKSEVLKCVKSLPGWEGLKILSQLGGDNAETEIKRLLPDAMADLPAHDALLDRTLHRLTPQLCEYPKEVILMLHRLGSRLLWVVDEGARPKENEDLGPWVSVSLALRGAWDRSWESSPPALPAITTLVKSASSDGESPLLVRLGAGQLLLEALLEWGWRWPAELRDEAAASLLSLISDGLNESTNRSDEMPAAASHVLVDILKDFPRCEAEHFLLALSDDWFSDSPSLIDVDIETARWCLIWALIGCETKNSIKKVVSLALGEPDESAQSHLVGGNILRQFPKGNAARLLVRELCERARVRDATSSRAIGYLVSAVRGGENQEATVECLREIAADDDAIIELRLRAELGLAELGIEHSPSSFPTYRDDAAILSLRGLAQFMARILRETESNPLTQSMRELADCDDAIVKHTALLGLAQAKDQQAISVLANLWQSVTNVRSKASPAVAWSQRHPCLRDCVEIDEENIQCDTAYRFASTATGFTTLFPAVIEAMPFLVEDSRSDLFNAVRELVVELMFEEPSASNDDVVGRLLELGNQRDEDDESEASAGLRAIVPLMWKAASSDDARKDLLSRVESVTAPREITPHSAYEA